MKQSKEFHRYEPRNKLPPLSHTPVKKKVKRKRKVESPVCVNFDLLVDDLHFSEEKD